MTPPRLSLLKQGRHLVISFRQLQTDRSLWMAFPSFGVFVSLHFRGHRIVFLRQCEQADAGLFVEDLGGQGAVPLGALEQVRGGVHAP